MRKARTRLPPRLSVSSSALGISEIGKSTQTSSKLPGVSPLTVKTIDEYLQRAIHFEEMAAAEADPQAQREAVGAGTGVPKIGGPTSKGARNTRTGSPAATIKLIER